MSEISLILIDSEQIVSGTIHAGTGDRLVAALSAEPETVVELEAALLRFDKCPFSFAQSPNFVSRQFAPSAIEYRPYDAGILIIDLAARLLAVESTYSHPHRAGQISYHDGSCTTDLPMLYFLPDDWKFVDSIEEYDRICGERREKRLAIQPLDTRAILYGRPLLEFIANHVRTASACRSVAAYTASDPIDRDPLADFITELHTEWLLTSRKDLRDASPRDVMLAKQDFIKADLESRALQWSFQLEGPPCLSADSFAYRFAGFGFHEWVMYYELVRHLLYCAIRIVTDIEEGDAKNELEFSLVPQELLQGEVCSSVPLGSNSLITPLAGSDSNVDMFESLIAQLDELKLAWLTEPYSDLEGHIPFLLIDNERRRLPEAMGGRSMVVDEDCPICKTAGDESEAGLGVWFWHLDGSNMDDHFAFSTFKTEEEYEADRLETELRHREFDPERKEPEERIVSDSVFDPIELDEHIPSIQFETEPPEA